MIEKIISAWVSVLEKKNLKNVWLWKPFSTTSNHKNDSTRGLPYQYTVHQALQIMQIHVNGLMKSWPPHSDKVLCQYQFLMKSSCSPIPFWPNILTLSRMGGCWLHQLFWKLVLALSILIFVIQKPYDNFSWAIL